MATKLERLNMKSKIVVEVLPTFAEMQEAMDEHCAENSWVGAVPPVAETDYLAIEADESLNEDSKFEELGPPEITGANQPLSKK